MSAKPILLFLHGVRDGDHDEGWRGRLAETLSAHGYPALENVLVVAPIYAHALKGWDEKVPLPAVTVKQLPREEARQNRRDFERRMGAIEYRLGKHDRGHSFVGADAAVGVAIGLPYFKQAQNYLTTREIRAQVLTRVLEKLPTSGRLVIVGHSLGSVIAADLVPRLPVGLEIEGMVTIGSPLASSAFNVENLRETLREPPKILRWWVNFWNAPDLVAARRGVSSVFPWMIDFRIDTKAVMPRAHSATEYLTNDSVAAAIGFALYGSTSNEVVRSEKGVDVPTDEVEQLSLLALRFAHLIHIRLDGDLRNRFGGALQQVQATAVDGLSERRRREKRPMPSQVARLAVDLSSPDPALPEPHPTRHMSKEETVPLLIVLAAENILRPYEISVPEEKRKDAMKDLAAEMGVTSQYGTDVFEASKRARDVLGGGRPGVNWVKLGAMGAGAAAIVAATGGLALAAAPGLAGAALITSALAAFGPGGMIGGLLTAGTLVTAGGGGIAFGLASPGTSAATLEAVVARQLAASILRQLQNLEQDPAVWRNLVETEIEVRREYERLDEFSDESAPALNELKSKFEAVERALKYLRENGLAPGGGDVPEGDPGRGKRAPRAADKEETNQ